MNKLDQLMAFLKQKEELQATKPLRYLMWEPSLQCNLECLHCSNECTQSNTMESKELTTSEIKNELLDISKHYDANEIRFVVTGGEPLMRSDLMEVGEYAYSLRYKFGITTNGILLNQKSVQSLQKAHLSSIAISLDGIATHHDKLRNSIGAYDKTIKGIKCLFEQNFQGSISILCCVSSINVYHLEEFIEELIELGICTVRFTPIFGQGRATGQNHLMLSDEELYYLLNFIKEYRKGETKINIALGDDGYYGVDFECHIRNSLHYCGAGIEWGAILYDGSVTGATHISNKYSEGNIRDNSFVEIWENRFYDYREGREALFAPYCKDCEEWVLCEGGGFHLLDQQLDGSELCGYKKLRRMENGQ